MAEEKRHQTRVTIVTPYTNFFESKADSVTLPSQDGSVGIMAGHMPLVIALFPGICSIRIGDETKYCVITEGYAEIGQHMVLIVSNSAEWPEDIDIRRAYISHKANEDLLKQTDPKELIKVGNIKEKLNRANARLHLIELYGNEQQKALLESLRNDTAN